MEPRSGSMQMFIKANVRHEYTLVASDFCAICKHILF